MGKTRTQRRAERQSTVSGYLADRVCSGKVRFTSKRSAVGRASAIGGMEAYHCNVCGGHHLRTPRHYRNRVS